MPKLRLILIPEEYLLTIAAGGDLEGRLPVNIVQWARNKCLRSPLYEKLAQIMDGYHKKLEGRLSALVGDEKAVQIEDDIRKAIQAHNN